MVIYTDSQFANDILMLPWVPPFISSANGADSGMAELLWRHGRLAPQGGGLHDRCHIKPDVGHVRTGQVNPVKYLQTLRWDETLT